MAELGASTPYIICPGDWSASAIEFHARAVVSMCVHNGHFNCLAAQNIIVSKTWPQRKAFLRAIPGVLDGFALYFIPEIFDFFQSTAMESADKKTGLL